MLVFTDHSAPQPYLTPYGLTQIHALADFAAVSSKLRDFTAAAVVATGHGCIGGIGARGVVISPYALLQAVRAIPGIEVGLVVLCQCYAGVFHRMDATTKPHLVLLGATHLNPSLSAPFELKTPLQQRDGKAGIQDWVANIFMVKLFDWLNAPSDIDGDGDRTLMDAYKYAGAESNQDLVAIKSRLYVEADTLSSQVRDLAKLPPSPIQKIQLEAASRKLQSRLETLYLHQEPWILHAELARAVCFEPR